MTDAQRLRAFHQGFQNLRRATHSALHAGDAEAARRSVALAETYLDELRWLYGMLPDAARGVAWLMTSVQRGA